MTGLDDYYDNPLPKQEYYSKPLTKHEVRGASSKTIFKFMTTPFDARKIRLMSFNHPKDVDDFERNRALLLYYPEWKIRLPEMGIICKEWNSLVNNWASIEQLYDEDYIKYGNKAYKIGKCDNYIRSLIK